MRLHVHCTAFLHDHNYALFPLLFLPLIGYAAAEKITTAGHGAALTGIHNPSPPASVLLSGCDVDPLLDLPRID
jgi:hypothetical protein